MTKRLTTLHPKGPSLLGWDERNIKLEPTGMSRPLGRGVTGLTLIEFLAILCILLVFAGTFVFYTKITLRTAKETALRYELANMRLSIEHYRMLKGGLPPSLFTLMNQGLTETLANGIILSKKFLQPFRVDKEGYLIDPFMQRYAYDGRQGRVNSRTGRYQNW